MKQLKFSMVLVLGLLASCKSATPQTVPDVSTNELKLTVLYQNTSQRMVIRRLETSLETCVIYERFDQITMECWRNNDTR